MGTIRFEIRTSKADKHGKMPIRMIYQVSGQRKFYPTAEKCMPINWHTKKQRAVFIDKKAARKIDPTIDPELLLTASEVMELNSNLEKLQNDVLDIVKRFDLDKVTLTPERVIDALKESQQPKEKRDQPGVYLVAFIERFARESTSTHKAGTLKVYTGLAAHLANFEKLTRIKGTFEKVDISYFRSFQTYLAEELKMNNITIAKLISTLKTLLNYARTMYKIEVNQDYRDFKISRKDSDFEVITLTNDEFLTLFNMDLTENKRLDQVRDVFCFSCATGLRYSDLTQLKREHIRKDHTIKMTAAKTGQRLDIPLNPFSAAILAKYTEKHKPLPVISGQKTNEYLKELCELAGIDSPVEKVREYGVKKVAKLYKKYELISIHTGRKTFTTLSLEKGIAPQEVMAITGHTTYKAFKRYVDVTSKRKQAVMAKAWGEVKDGNLKIV